MRWPLLGLVALLIAAGEMPARAVTVPQTFNFSTPSLWPLDNPIVGSRYDPAGRTMFDTAYGSSNGFLFFGYRGDAPPTAIFPLAFGDFWKGWPWPFYFNFRDGKWSDPPSSDASISSVPVPSSIITMISALGGLAMLALHKRRRARNA